MGGAGKKVDYMNKVKHLFSGALGFFGTVLFYIIQVFMIFSPLLILGFNSWVRLLIIVAVLATGGLGALFMFGLWVWASVIVVLSSFPTEPAYIIFYVTLAVYVFLFLLFPLISAGIGYLFSRRNRNDNE